MAAIHDEGPVPPAPPAGPEIDILNLPVGPDVQPVLPMPEPPPPPFFPDLPAFDSPPSNDMTRDDS